MSHHRLAVVTVVTALVLDVACGYLFARFQHIPVWHGLFCALANAVTDGGDVGPTTRGGYAVTAAEYVLVVPLFAATFSLFTSALAAMHVRRSEKNVQDRVVAAEERLRAHITSRT